MCFGDRNTFDNEVEEESKLVSKGHKTLLLCDTSVYRRKNMYIIKYTISNDIVFSLTQMVS